MSTTDNKANITDNEDNVSDTAKFINVYWDYYLILEQDVLEIEPYVAFHPNNYCCFSTQFIKLYLSICSEIDVICKEYCKYLKNIKDLPKHTNIRYFAECILKEHPEISQQKVAMQKSKRELSPWKDWENSTPNWWEKHNDIKHNRTGKLVNGKNKFNYQHANLYNVLNALAALYVLEKYFYKDLAERDAPIGKRPYILLEPSSKMFGFFDFDIECRAWISHLIY